MIKELQFENRFLFLTITVGSLLLCVIALGPGLFTNEITSATNWQYLVFKDLCHQETARSYTFNNIQMAVCSRCLGIYTSLFASWILMPLFSYLGRQQKKMFKRLFSAAIVLNLLDVLGNLIGFWANTSGSRLILGILLGTSITLLLSNEFFKQLNYEN